MRVDASAASRAPTAPARQAPRRRAFGAALALARTVSEVGRQARAGLATPATTGITLARRRHGADEGQRKLWERRDEAQPCAARGPDGQQRPAGDLRPPEPAPAATLVPASAIERLAVEIGRMAGRPFVELGFGRDLHVRITRSPRGVEVLLQPSAKLRWAASAELPGLLAALRARGVAVASARVSDSAPAPAGSRALTPRRGSATNAATSGGTVAKW